MRRDYDRVYPMNGQVFRAETFFTNIFQLWFSCKTDSQKCNLCLSYYRVLQTEKLVFALTEFMVRQEFFSFSWQWWDLSHEKSEWCFQLSLLPMIVDFFSMEKLWRCQSLLASLDARESESRVSESFQRGKMEKLFQEKVVAKSVMTRLKTNLTLATLLSSFAFSPKRTFCLKSIRFGGKLWIMGSRGLRFLIFG